jgi:hypothetical protein
MKMYEVLELQNLYNSIANIKLPLKTTYKFARLMKRTEEEIIFYQEKFREIVEEYGVDSYISRSACILYGSTDTVFYIGAVYFAGLKRKKLSLALAIALFSYLVGTVFCCFLCRFL